MSRSDTPPDDYGATIAGNLAAVRSPSSSGDAGTGATLPGTPAPSGTSPGFGSRHSLASVAPALEAGTILAGRYQILALLGEGGMGAVYKAQDLELERTVALKTILPQMAANPAMLARFKQEVLLASQITHRNVVRLYDLGESDGLKFITMEFVEGQDLRSILQEHGKFSPTEAVSIIRQVCLALEAAHAQGVVHRDLKPQNIMRERRPTLDGLSFPTRVPEDRIVVMDFGLARTLQSSGMTQTGALVGTMEYMSPEQALGEDVDSRSDLFAVGLIFYELLSGQVPYCAESAIASLLKRTQQRATPVSDIEASVPPVLSNVVSKCLERDRSLRYQSATELLQDLEVWQAPDAARSVARPVALHRPVSRRRWYAIGAAVLALALIGTGIGFRSRIFSPSSQSTQQPNGPAVSLAILPFRNASGDPQLDWLDNSMVEMLRTSLGESAQLRTVSPERATQVLSDLRVAPNSLLDAQTLQRVAEFTKADTLVSGQFVRLGTQLRITATIQDLKNNRTLPLQVDAASDKDIPGAVNRLAGMLRQNLAVSPDALKELLASSFQPTSKSVAATRDYNEGLRFFRQGRNLDAVKALESATAQDPSFASAYAQLAQSYSNLGFDDKAEEASRKAIDLGQQVSATERFIIQAGHERVTKDNKKAVEAYEKLAKTFANNPDIEYALGSSYLDAGDYDKARAEFSKLLQADPKNIKALWQMGVLNIMKEDPQGALDPLNQALTLAIQSDNREQQALVTQAIGISYRLLNKPEDAMRNYQQSMDINKRLGLKRNLAANYSEIAQIQNATGKPDVAVASYEQALQLQREIGAKKESGDTLINIGVLYADRGKYDKALQSYKESLQIQRDAGDANYQALCLNNIGLVYLSEGDTDDALTYFQQALQIREKLGVPTDIAASVDGLGQAFTATGQYDDALSAFMRALDLWRKAGNAAGAATESHSIGLVLRYQGRYGAAINAMQDAVKGLRELGQRNRDMAEFLTDLADTLAQAGRGSESGTSLDEAAALARDLKNDPLQAAVLNARGDVAYYSGNVKSAIPSYDAALRAASRGTEKDKILTSRLNLAKAAIADGRSKAVIADLRNISNQAAALGYKYLSLESTVYMAQAMIDARDHDHAKQELDAALSKSDKLGTKLLTGRIHYLIASATRLGGNSADAASQYRQALSLLGDLKKEPGSDHLLDRDDLKIMYAEASRWSQSAKN